MKHWYGSRQGFTMLELLVVLSIALVLTAMSIGVLSKQMRKAAVRKAAADVIAACEQARALSVRGNSIERRHYGVRLGFLETTKQSTVEIVVLDERANTAGELPVYMVSGKPIYSVKLPNIAQIYIGDTHIKQYMETSARPVQWLYKDGIGTVHTNKVNSGTLDRTRSGVGMKVMDSNNVWGITNYNMKSADMSVLVTASDEPALSIRALDGSTKIALGVFPAGVSFKYEF